MRHIIGHVVVLVIVWVTLIGAAIWSILPYIELARTALERIADV